MKSSACCTTRPSARLPAEMTKSEDTVWVDRLPSDLSFRRFDAAAARAQRDTVELIYRDAHAHSIASGDPFRSVETFMTRFNAYTSRDGFDHVIAYFDGEPVGQSWGWALKPDSAWWHGLVAEPEPGFTVETGTRTFGFSELMVRKRWPGRGIAHALHDESSGSAGSPALPCWSCPTTPPPTGSTPGGAGARSPSCGPAGPMRRCLMC